jgi:hypothetical protein
MAWIDLRLSTRPVEQIKRAMTPELRQAIVDGAYWLREPSPDSAALSRRESTRVNPPHLLSHATRFSYFCGSP